MLNCKLYTERIKPFVNKPLVKDVSGVRPCGKSTLLKLLAEELRAIVFTGIRLLFCR
ncbi:MAG: hypothetical protein WCI18_01085 [Pseudomonadota bacterium]